MNAANITEEHTKKHVLEMISAMISYIQNNNNKHK